MSIKKLRWEWIEACGLFAGSMLFEVYVLVKFSFMASATKLALGSMLLAFPFIWWYARKQFVALHALINRPDEYHTAHRLFQVTVVAPCTVLLTMLVTVSLILSR